jgi:hypothetical protein
VDERRLVVHTGVLQFIVVQFDAATMPSSRIVAT